MHKRILWICNHVTLMDAEVPLLNSLGFKQIGEEKVSFYKDEDGNDIYFDGGLFELIF